MSKQVKTVDVLLETRKLVANKKTWCKGLPAMSAKGNGVNANSKRAVRWCVLGALVKVSNDKTGSNNTSDIIFPKGVVALLCALDTLSQRRGYYSIVSANDYGGQKVVLSVLDDAIAELESK